MPILNIYKLDPNAILPTRATSGSACRDLYACLPKEGLLIAPEERVLVPTGLVFDIPEHHVVKIYSRSGLALKRGLSLPNGVGVIDSDYKQQIFAMFINHSGVAQVIDPGDRVAQFEMHEVLPYELREVLAPPVSAGERDGGFGSTGK